jgi:hypothetical protein
MPRVLGACLLELAAYRVARANAAADAPGVPPDVPWSEDYEGDDELLDSTHRTTQLLRPDADDEGGEQ